MKNQLKSASRRITLLPVLLLLVLFTSSCSHRTVPTSAGQAASPPQSVVPAAAVQPKTFQPIAFPYLPTSEISSLAFSPDGKRLAFGYGTDAAVTFWNLEAGRLAWQRHVDAASGGPIQFEPHGRFLVSQFSDPDSDPPVIASTLGGRRLGIPTCFGGGGNARLEGSGRFLVVSGSQEGVLGSYKQREAVEVWDTHTWRRMDRVARVLNGAGPDTDFGSGDSGFVPLTAGGKVIQALIRKSTVYKNLQICSVLGGQYRDYPDGQGTRDTAYSDKYRAWVWETLGRIEVTDRKTNSHVRLQTLAHDTARMPAISPNGNLLAVPTTEGTVFLWNLRTGKLLAKVQCSADVLRCAVFSPNSRVLAVAGGSEYPDAGDGIRLLDTSTCKVFAVLKAAFPQSENEANEKDWTLNHPDWFASLPDLSYIASDSVIKKIRTPGRARDPEIIRRFNRPERVRAALRNSYQS